MNDIDKCLRQFLTRRKYDFRCQDAVFGVDAAHQVRLIAGQTNQVYRAAAVDTE